MTHADLLLDDIVDYCHNLGVMPGDEEFTRQFFLKVYSLACRRFEQALEGQREELSREFGAAMEREREQRVARTKNVSEN